MSYNQDFGNDGEQLAVDYLKKKSYEILETNWRFKHKEIDIIAKYNNFLIIIEVKTRSVNYLIEPYVAVDRKKQKDLIIAANAYVVKKDLDIEVQFDIISIVITPKESKIEHIEDAFYARI